MRLPSANHHVLPRLLGRRIKCRTTLVLVDRIVFSVGSHFDPGSRHLPIGNLTSQWFANSYPTELDRFVKQHLRVRYYLF